MLKILITYLKGLLQANNIVEKVFFAELKKSGEFILPVVPENDYSHINWDEFNGIIYIRKNGTITSSDSPAVGKACGRNYYYSVPLRIVAGLTQNNDCFLSDGLAERIISVVSGKNTTLKDSLSASSVNVKLEAYETDAEKIALQEYSGDPQFNYDLIYVAVDVRVEILSQTNLSCFDPCETVSFSFEAPTFCERVNDCVEQAAFGCEDVLECDILLDVIEGTNVTIDKTDPKRPIINATGGGDSCTCTPCLRNITFEDPAEDIANGYQLFTWVYNDGKVCYNGVGPSRLNYPTDPTKTYKVTIDVIVTSVTPGTFTISVWGDINVVDTTQTFELEYFGGDAVSPYIIFANTDVNNQVCIDNITICEVYANKTHTHETTDITGLDDDLTALDLRITANESDIVDLQNEKQDKLITTNRQNASYQLVASDADKLVEMNVAGANNLTIPAATFSAGQQILIAQYGAGQTTVVAGAGMTIRSAGGLLNLTSQYSGATIIFLSASECYLFGDLS